MSEDQALTTQTTLGDLPVSVPQNLNADDFGGASFLPALRLYTSNSKQVKSKAVPVDNWCVVKGANNIVPLGTEVDVVLLGWRAKAIDMSDEENIISTYDKDSATFKLIQDKSDTKDSGCMWGPEFLAYVPEEERFVLVFLGTKSARNVTDAFVSQIQKFSTLTNQFIETKKYSWTAPDIQACSNTYPLPGREAILKVLEDFNNPKESSVELDSEDEGDSSRE